MRTLLNTVTFSKPKKGESAVPIPGLHVGTLDNEKAGESKKYVIGNGVDKDHCVIAFQDAFTAEALLHICLDAYHGHPAADHVKAALDSLKAPSAPAPEPAPEA